jgi:predicted Zn-dependent protease
VSKGAAAGYVASYSRDQESQADELGAEYLARNRYDPQNMIEVIQALKNQEQFAIDTAKAEGKPAPSGSNWLSSHPANDKRLADIKAFAAKYQGQSGYADDGRARYLQAIAGMTFGDSAEQGLVRGRNFYHPALGIALTRRGLADPEHARGDRARQRRRRRRPDRARGAAQGRQRRTTR